MVDKRPIGYQPGKKYILDQKPPKTKKFDHIEKNIDTGLTIKDVQMKSDNFISNMKSCSFKRIKAATLAKLLEFEDTGLENIQQIPQVQEETAQNLKIIQHFNDDINEYQDNKSQCSNITYTTNQIQQKLKQKQSDPTEELKNFANFLLLDLREAEDYNQFHIKYATNFPFPKLKREQYIPEIYTYKNKEGKIIIICAKDEKNGIEIAKIFTEKQFDNFFLLSLGIINFTSLTFAIGIENFVVEFPQLCEGINVPNIKKDIIYKRVNQTEKSTKAEIQELFDNQNVIDDKLSQVSNITKSTKKGTKTAFKLKPVTKMETSYSVSYGPKQQK